MASGLLKRLSIGAHRRLLPIKGVDHFHGLIGAKGVLDLSGLKGVQRLAIARLEIGKDVRHLAQGTILIEDAHHDRVAALGGQISKGLMRLGRIGRKGPQRGASLARLHGLLHHAQERELLGHAHAQINSTSASALDGHLHRRAIGLELPDRCGQRRAKHIAEIGIAHDRILVFENAIGRGEKAGHLLRDAARGSRGPHGGGGHIRHALIGERADP